MVITGVRFRRGICLLHFGCCCIFLTGCGSPNSTEYLTTLEKQAMEGDYPAARATALSIPVDDPLWENAQLILGEMEMNSGTPEAALERFNSIRENGSLTSLRAAEFAASYYLNHCQLSPAIAHFEYIVSQTPRDSTLRSRLATLLVMSGQRTRADHHLMQLLQYGRIELKELVMLTQPHRQSMESTLFSLCDSGDQQDPLTSFAVAAMKIPHERPEVARDRLRQMLRSSPDLAQAQALLGELLLDSVPAEFDSWRIALPKNVRNHPHVWYVLGMWFRRLGENEVAVRCLWESVKQDPCHERAIYQLGQALAPLKPEASAAFQKRAELLREGTLLTENVLISEGRDAKTFVRFIEILVDTGRFWEALGWTSLLGNDVNLHELPEHISKAIASVKKSRLPRFTTEFDLTRIYDFSDFPSPSFDTTSATPNQSPLASAQSRFPLHFVDEAAATGIDFTYFQSAGSDSSTVRIFESTGGGLGIVDFDLDGWADMLLPQGNEWPAGSRFPEPSASYNDALYRNLRTGFVNVAGLAGLNSQSYGQGCSVGDFNNDGFPDLYIAAIGANRLLVNNGDGTFSDVTRLAGISHSAWTTSCVILDLNADGNPDIYDVNYLQGDDVFLVECGKSRCSVLAFEGAPDQVLVSQGDGTFEYIPDATPTRNCKGLGLVALYPEGNLRPDLFIANDQVPNFFLRPTEGGRYTDEATQRGLAFNRNGQSTASMGVASGDINHDMLMDIFVTNFEDEANCLYLQHKNGFYEDAISGTGLASPGIPYVGWGTQFLDADNDGDLDLAVANGHVADFGEPNVEYSMPLQVFRNTGQVQFAMESPATSDSVLGQKLLGRSIAVLDWNRDGLEDFGLSCLETPFILATNKSSNAGHWVNVRLHADQSARDARGAIAEVHFGGTSLRKQLTAGDGYQASNERILHFGLGVHAAVERLTILWPSGQISSFNEIPVDRLVTISERIPTLLVWPK